jgi:hypothetical protein
MLTAAGSYQRRDSEFSDRLHDAGSRLNAVTGFSKAGARRRNTLFGQVGAVLAAGKVMQPKRADVKGAVDYSKPAQRTRKNSKVLRVNSAVASMLDKFDRETEYAVEQHEAENETDTCWSKTRTSQLALKRWLAGSYFAHVLHSVALVLSAASCITFALERDYEYHDHPVKQSSTEEFVISVAFCLDLAMKAATTESLRAYLGSFVGLIDLITSVFLLLVVDQAWLGFPWRVLTFVRTFRCLRIFRIAPMIQYIGTDVSLQMAVIGYMFMCVLWLSTAFMRWAEKSLTFWDAFYLNFTTISTIGYGQLSPHTIFGKYIVVVVVFVTFILIPFHTQKLISILNLSSFYQRNSYKPHEPGRHVVLCGEISFEGTRVRRGRACAGGARGGGGGGVKGCRCRCR